MDCVRFGRVVWGRGEGREGGSQVREKIFKIQQMAKQGQKVLRLSGDRGEQY